MRPTKIDHPTAGTATGYTHETVGEIEDMAVVRDETGALFSRWEASWRERFRILFSGVVWVGVMSQRQPPIIVVAGEHPAPEVFRHPWAHKRDCEPKAAT